MKNLKKLATSEISRFVYGFGPKLGENQDTMKQNPESQDGKLEKQKEDVQDLKEGVDGGKEKIGKSPEEIISLIKELEASGDYDNVYSVLKNLGVKRGSMKPNTPKMGGRQMIGEDVFKFPGSDGLYQFESRGKIIPYKPKNDESFKELGK